MKKFFVLFLLALAIVPEAKAFDADGYGWAYVTRKNYLGQCTISSWNQQGAAIRGYGTAQSTLDAGTWYAGYYTYANGLRDGNCDGAQGVFRVWGRDHAYNFQYRVNRDCGSHPWNFWEGCVQY